jgi:triacylglycerol lipase
MILLKLFTAVVALTATATARVVRRGKSIPSAPRPISGLMTRLDAEAAAAVNATTFADLILYEQYSAATYCTGNDVFQPGTEIACPAGNCPNVEQAHAVTWYSFLK